MVWQKIDRFPGSLMADGFIHGSARDQIDVTLLALASHFEAGRILGADGEVEVDQPFLKSNRVFRSRPDDSASAFENEIGPLIRAEFEGLFRDPEVRASLVALHPGLELRGKRLQVGEIQISAYGHGDYYVAHFDAGGTSRITINLLWCIGEQSFSGGSLKFHDPVDEAREAEIEFRKNRLVVFPCHTLHQVSRVELEGGRYENKRFSIQAWSELVDE